MVEAQIHQALPRSSEDHSVKCTINWRLWGVGIDLDILIHVQTRPIHHVKHPYWRFWGQVKSFQKWKVTCNFKFPKMASFGPTSTQLSNIKEASNEILSNMKVEDLSLPFPKSPRSWISNEWLRSYDQIIAKCAWNFKWPYLLNQDSKFGGSFCTILLMTWSFQINNHIA